jgi:hypothetical protein
MTPPVQRPLMRIRRPAPLMGLLAIAVLASACSDRDPVGAAPGVKAGGIPPLVLAQETPGWKRAMSAIIHSDLLPGGSSGPEVKMERTLDETAAKLTFEGWPDNKLLPPHIDQLGANFSEWLTLVSADSGGLGDFSAQPSGKTIAFWNVGNPTCLSDPAVELGSPACLIYRDILLDVPARRVSFAYTSAVSVSLTALNANGAVLDTMSGPANLENPVNPGDRNYRNWNRLTVSSTTDIITHIRIRGYNQFTGIDNLTLVRSNLPPDRATIENSPPTVDEGGTATFTGSGHDPEDGTAGLTFEWDFGNGTTATGANATGTFLDNPAGGGTVFPVTLTVKDQNGKPLTTTSTVNVRNVAPSLNSVPNLSGAAGATLSATASFTDPGADSWTAAIDWNTASTVDAIETQTLSGHVVNLSHAYAASGSYNASVTVTDDDGGSSTRNFQVNVTNEPVTFPPFLGATLDEPGSYTSTVTFDDDGAGPWTVTVDYDDHGSPVVTQTVSGKSFVLSHVYADNGDYGVKVGINDGQYTVSRTAEVKVDNVPPTATFSVPTSSVIQNTPFTVSFTNAHDVGPKDLTFEYAFDCGNGVLGGYSSTPSASCTIGSVGTRSVKGRVRDKDTGYTEYSMDVTVVAANAPVSLGTVPDASIDEGSTYSPSVPFNDPDAGPWTVKVTYGDGSPQESSVVSVRTVPLSHVYADNGTFTVKVTVDDGSGPVQGTGTVTVANVAPTATFNAPASVPQNAALLLSFTAPSDPSPADLAALQYAFDCGTGYSALAASATATCPTTTMGTRTVKGKVQDKNGGATEYTRSVTVTAPSNPAPVVTASAAASIVPCVAGVGAVKLTGTATDSDPLTVAWYEGATLKSSTLSPTLILPLGAHTLQLRATEQRTGGATSTANVAVTIKDTSAPLVDVSASPSSLWPPNHKYVTVAVNANAADLCTLLTPNSTLAGYVESSEADQGNGDGNTTGDIKVTHVHAGNTVELSSNSHRRVTFHRGDKLEVRSERVGNTDRVYTISMSATDDGGTGQDTATVRVSQSQSNSDRDDDDDDRDHRD